MNHCYLLKSFLSESPIFCSICLLESSAESPLFPPNALLIAFWALSFKASVFFSPITRFRIVLVAFFVSMPMFGELHFPPNVNPNSSFLTLKFKYAFMLSLSKSKFAPLLVIEVFLEFALKFAFRAFLLILPSIFMLS